ncbi:uncharacterized protein LOC123557534 [Mercenaria mercenaria]|uniref:uncharacterized protein LOC123557534 n=1 Tax=Mercenaria mercenaria TaxID=6596 RepID=UPI00234E37DC|nr:uncharacterized protein LOC123557534 [Mercenaria mercenaria]
MDEFAAECLDRYGNGSSTESSSSNDVAIWPLAVQNAAGFKEITGKESRNYKKCLQNHHYSTDAYTESMRTPMAELLKQNLQVEPSPVKEACEHKDNWKRKFVNCVERKIRKKSMSLIKEINLL